jgi:hypothetical protein
MGTDLSRNELAGIIFKLAILLVLLSVFYAVFFSAWYWYDRAQLSPETPSPPVACASSANDEVLKGTEFEDHCDYAGFRSFWGDDIVGQFFRAIFAIVFRFFVEVFQPWFSTTFVPWWNFMIKPTGARIAFAGAFGFVFTYFLMKFADEVYEYWKKGHARQGNRRDDEGS